YRDTIHDGKITCIKHSQVIFGSNPKEMALNLRKQELDQILDLDLTDTEKQSLLEEILRKSEATYEFNLDQFSTGVSESTSNMIIWFTSDQSLMVMEKMKDGSVNQITKINRFGRNVVQLDNDLNVIRSSRPFNSSYANDSRYTFSSPAVIRAFPFFAW